MTDKNSPLFSTIVTALALIFTGILLTLMMLVVLNGFSERDGLIVLGISLAGQIAVGIFCVTLARRMTVRLITKSNWKNIPAIIVSALAGTFAGFVLNTIFIAIAIFIGELIS